METAGREAQGEPTDARPPSSRIGKGRFFRLVGAASVLISLVLGAATLLWPPLVNGQPFFLADTPAYIRGADAGVYRLLGRGTEWTDVYRAEHERYQTPVSDYGAGSAHRPNSEPPVILSGRSVYYGAILYAGYMAGSLWFVVILQALLVLTALALTWRRLRGPLISSAPWHPAAALIALSVLTPIGYFTGYLVPDIFSGLAILAVGHLLIFSGEQGKGEGAFWIATLSFALLSHSANLLIVGGLLVVAITAAGLKMMRIRGRGAALVGAALAIGIGGEYAFGAAVRTFTGEQPVRPPFVMARVIADGPGRDYLIQSCPQAGFFLCRFVDALPTHSDGFLWAPARPEGLFSVLPSGQQRVLAQEQTSFLLAVAKDRPFALVASSLSSAAEQAGKFGLMEFNYNASARNGFEDKLPARVLERTRSSAAYRERMPVKWVEWVTLPTLIAASLWLLWLCARRRGPDDRKGNRLVALVVLGVVLNAVVCGALSTPHDRYQMRLIWLIPFLALAVPARRPRLGQPPPIAA